MSIFRLAASKGRNMNCILNILFNSYFTHTFTIHVCIRISENIIDNASRTEYCKYYLLLSSLLFSCFAQKSLIVIIISYQSLIWRNLRKKSPLVLWSTIEQIVKCENWCLRKQNIFVLNELNAFEKLICATFSSFQRL